MQCSTTQNPNASEQVPPAYYPQEQQDRPDRGMCERNTLEEAAGAEDVPVFGPEEAKACIYLLNIQPRTMNARLVLRNRPNFHSLE
jgi:hypothetical protein